MCDDKCLGCMQPDTMHKYCPAHGTYFYMSGVPYTPEIHAMRRRYGVEMTDAIFKALQHCKDKDPQLDKLKALEPPEESVGQDLHMSREAQVE